MKHVFYIQLVIKENQMQYFISIDLGGTHIRGALLNSEFEIIKFRKEKTIHSNSAEQIIHQILNLIKVIDTDKQACSLGIGVPGVVDRQGNIWYISNIPELENVNIKCILQNLLGYPIFVINDCNAAALAESNMGAGRNNRIVYYVTISTGIGGGLIINDKLIEGSRGFAGEVGSILVKSRNEAGGNSFRGLYPGAVEGYASGDGLIERAKKFSKELNSAEEVFIALDEKQDWAIKLVDEMIEDLSMMFANISYVINPDVFVIGGGCMKRADCFWDRVILAFQAKTDAILHNTRFEKAELDEPGILGCAIFAAQKYTGHKNK